MAEYIEREAALKAMQFVTNDPTCPLHIAAEIDQYIMEAPAADVVEVKHGQWLPQIVLGQKAWDCSECKTLGSPHWNWCPVCGAKMDGGKNNAAD